MSDSPGVKPVDRLLTTPEVAERLGVTPKTVRTWIRQGLIRTAKFGAASKSLVRIRESDFDDFVNVHSKGGRHDS